MLEILEINLNDSKLMTDDLTLLYANHFKTKALNGFFKPRSPPPVYILMLTAIREKSKEKHVDQLIKDDFRSTRHCL